MKESEVRTHLDNLLVELEVFCDEGEVRRGLINRIISIANFYYKDYPNLMTEYKDRGNSIIKQRIY
jgi:hypothetical protein